ncbi:YncE family protein [Empedobacter brevis]|uniref:YncE family protein n=1 Tax=Empedobacter brevis TaxID=247 RepID=UPI0028AC966E|nr:DUF5074 domain-containing protein [Empedobacter brevis]
MTKFKSIALVVLAGLFLQSCSNDDDGPNNDPENGTYSKGVFILNEGAYGKSNADVTYYNPNSKLSETNPIQGIFKKANAGQTLGDVAQDILLKGNKAYVVVNNSNKVEIVDPTTFKRISTITDNIVNPRYIAVNDKYIYVTNWGSPSNSTDDYIAVFNVSDYKFVKKIAVAEGPGHIIVENNIIYVAFEESGRENVYGKSVSIIDETKNITTTIGVGDAPTDMVKKGTNLYVLSQGLPSWNANESAGSLTRIDLANNNNTTTFNFGKTEHPAHLSESDGYLYYAINNDVYKMKTDATTLPTTKFFKSSATYLYGLKVDGNNIYVLDAKDFNSAGNLSIYNTSGVLQEDVTTGIGPNAVLVKK